MTNSKSLSIPVALITFKPFAFSITLNGILPQPHGKTAIITGLNYCSRIFAILGEILVRIRVDKRSPPQGAFATARLEEVQNLHTKIISAMAHAPTPLRLKPAAASLGMGGSLSQGSANGAGGVDYDYGGAGFRKATFAEVKDFFDNPNASRENASNPFLVMQANLYVTQVRSSRLLKNFTSWYWILIYDFFFLALVATCSIRH